MARVEKVVIDASVAVKWYNMEVDTEKALGLRAAYAAGRVDLAAPYLIAYEVANSLRYNPDFGEMDARSAINDLFDMQIDFRLLDPDQIEKSFELAYKHGITVYDSTYLALAETGGSTLYTADDRLVTKVPAGMVRHIRDYDKPS